MCAASEVSYLNGPGKGVVLVKVDDGDQLVGFKVALSSEDILVVKTSLGGEQKLFAQSLGSVGSGRQRPGNLETGSDQRSRAADPRSAAAVRHD